MGVHSVRGQSQSKSSDRNEFERLAKESANAWQDDNHDLQRGGRGQGTWNGRHPRRRPHRSLHPE